MTMRWAANLLAVLVCAAIGVALVSGNMAVSPDVFSAADYVGFATMGGLLAVVLLAAVEWPLLVAAKTRTLPGTFAICVGAALVGAGIVFGLANLRPDGNELFDTAEAWKFVSIIAAASVSFALFSWLINIAKDPAESK